MKRALGSGLLTLLAGLVWWQHSSAPDLSDLRALEAAPRERRVRPPGGLDLKVSSRTPVQLRWTGGTLYRSTSDLAKMPLDLAHYPIAKLAEGEQFTDTALADGTRYTYLAVQGDHCSQVVTVDVPTKDLGSVVKPQFRIDKLHYTLQVWDGQRLVKTYPVAFGRNPLARKLFYDNSTTPEGYYRLTGLQPDSLFYKAYDIDYPNATDRLRYGMARKTGYQKPEGSSGYPTIGGEIEIHFGDIFHNVTNGCIAMRRADVDELFACPAIAVGVPVTIFGSELTPAIDRADMLNVQKLLKTAGFDPGAADGRLGSATSTALGLFQEKHHLPLTLLPDPATIAALSAGH
jgi:hypothetical protein